VIVVLGLPRHFTEADLAALARADVVAGKARQLASLRHLLPPRSDEVEITADVAAAVDRVRTAETPVVLAAGDPGFFGIVRALAVTVGSERLDVRPAVSSVAAAFAAVGLPWDDARVVVAHGRDPAVAVATCRRFPKVAVLTGPGFGAADLARTLDGIDRDLVVAEDLGHPSPQITQASPAEIADGMWREPNVVLVIDRRRAIDANGVAFPSRSTTDGWGLDEQAFEHHDGTIPSTEMRAVVLAWLGPGTGDLVWDVGAGSGSVAVEAARLGAAAVAIERNATRCARIRANAARHDVPVDIIEGEAPAALPPTGEPDAVFVGGGGTNVVLAAADRARRVVVAALRTLERVGPLLRALDEAGWQTDGTLLSAARIAPLPTGHRLTAAQPVFVVRGRRDAAPGLAHAVADHRWTP